MKQIFVYGSLRKGMYNYERYLKGKSRFVGYGYVKGCLYALKDAAYPALLDGDQDVFGEIYEIDEQVASAIDELEGCHKDALGEYYKARKIIRTTQGALLELEVYCFSLDYEKNAERLKAVIPHGDFVKYVKEEKKEAI
ncbi:gamma-glutamylcyclotransferase family protein [Longicatena caecimuris]|uniref:Gamma-glutamylcyclotransferase family protein n=1 Tax=Longicatena caecimuris TaxID=1796635 RepID=A0A4R3T1T5_9FIRM|nr:gamma-glutamylcyclotransferase family protein [Longicatena caecimuris]MCR1871066.1 gamma-glutamylcyclotransferase [Longicatena caecimuris]MCU0103611.1 gamma-glutamylcyclotransferase [Longicatena caecimuris]TCU54537.1 gamma-glutamylcyclotransferase (GGCT)/AIG2-like uncharacterized protein YtfP [Longicatena caecimuris]